MKKLITLSAIALIALATTVSFADEKKDNKSCRKEAKACCKSGNSAKACAKADAKSCNDKDSKETKSNANQSPKN